jgi:hypothetical protein
VPGDAARTCSLPLAAIMLRASAPLRADGGSESNSLPFSRRYMHRQSVTRHSGAQAAWTHWLETR